MAVFAVLFWTLPAPAQTKPVRTDPASIATGETLFNLHCSACHGVGGVGAKGPPLLDVGPAAVDFFLSTGRMPLSSPNEEPEPGPPFFNEDQIADIVAYVNYLDTVHGTPGPGIPDVTPPCGAEAANCPTLSEGNHVVPSQLRPVPRRFGGWGHAQPRLRGAERASGDAHADRRGHQGRARPMPSFGPGQFTDQQVSAIADYVRYMSTSNDPGGLGIAHFGPVPEGFVAVIFGLGLLLLVSRFIGNRG